MIYERLGNILKSPSEALVNPVNCEGVSGKGLALLFKLAFPANYSCYQSICKTRALKPGRIHLFPTGRLGLPKWIINFPTKDRWREKSKLSWVEGGLDALVVQLLFEGIRTVAIPPLGCGLGGLKWKDVEPLIRDRFAARADIVVNLYKPVEDALHDFPEEDEVVNGSK